MHERERPMLHDNNAFKSRPLSAMKNTNFSSSKNNQKKVDLKSLLKTTVTKPFLHKNFSEIPD